MILVFVATLDLIIQKTNIGIQKIDSLALLAYEMIIADFLLQNKLEKAGFFEKFFLVG